MGNYLEVDELPLCDQCNSRDQVVKVLHNCPYESLTQYESYGKIRI